MKKIVMLNCNPNNDDQEFDRCCSELAEILVKQGHDVRLIEMKDKKIEDCIGCYACWLKTPGICALVDDQTEILRSYVWADFVLLASPLIMGFVSALMKKTNDRMLPMVHPFLKLDHDRMAHYPRYDKEQRVGILIGDSGVDEPEAFETIRNVYRRAEFIRSLRQEDLKEVADEINNI